MPRRLTVMLSLLVMGLVASTVGAQMCPPPAPTFVGPLPPEQLACASGNTAYWARCGSTGTVCTPPTAGAGLCTCAKPPRCGAMNDGDCASDASCSSGTNTGYLAPCGAIAASQTGQRCTPFGPASAAPCCTCAKPACKPSNQHSKIVAEHSCVGGVNDGKLCEPYRACADCPNGTCPADSDVIPDYQ